LERTVRYLGVEVEDALEISEQTEVQGIAGRGESPSRTVIVLNTANGESPARYGTTATTAVWLVYR
jgi:hypothetical protein